MVAAQGTVADTSEDLLDLRAALDQARDVSCIRPVMRVVILSKWCFMYRTQTS